LFDLLLRRAALLEQAPLALERLGREVELRLRCDDPSAVRRRAHSLDVRGGERELRARLVELPLEVGDLRALDGREDRPAGNAVAEPDVHRAGEGPDPRDALLLALGVRLDRAVCDERGDGRSRRDGLEAEADSL